MDKKLLNGGIFAEAATQQMSAAAIRGVQCVVLGFLTGTSRFKRAWAD